MQALGIDIGSTSIKGAVLDLERSVVNDPVALPFPTPLTGLKSGWVEIDPATIMRAVDELLSVLVQRAVEPGLLLVSGKWVV